MATYNPKDHFFHKAKQDGFVARSAYKLLELNEKYHIFKSGNRVLDLGCSPGSWSQVALKIIGGQGRLLGIDLKPVTLKPVPNAEFRIGDILQTPAGELSGPFDVILSDMAPNTTGIRLRDQAQSEELCRMAHTVAKALLRPGGHLVMKIFEGPDAEKFIKELQSGFKKIARFKPKAVRKGSFETYVVCLTKV